MSRRTIVLVVALLLAAASAFAIWNFLSNVDEDARKGLDEVAVFRAIELIDRGANGDDVLGSFEESTENQDFLPDNAITTLDQLEATLRGRVSLGPISAQQIVTTDLWGDRVEAVATLSALITPGRQAITIRPDEVRGVAGLIRPGDHINVVATADISFADVINLLKAPSARALFFPDLQESLGYDDEQMVELANALPLQTTITEFVLQDLLVLAVGAEARIPADEVLDVTDTTDASGEEGLATLGSQLITIEVTAAQAEQLVFSQENLKTWLTLVPVGFEPEETAGATIADLIDLFGPVVEELRRLAEIVQPANIGP